ncbi:MAG: hypothetical protein M0Z69_05960 [Actinomycetota bacterium]|nr:hypothetical protein [Actinomycetota bacterium]
MSAKHARCGGPAGPLGSPCKAVDPVLVGEHHDAARRVEERHGAPGGILDVDARRRWLVVWVAGRRVVGPRPVELAVADDDTADFEDEAL